MSFHVFPLRFCLSLVRFFVSSFRFVLADSQPRSRRVAPASAVRNLWWCGKKTGNPKRFVQSQSKNTRNITKYTEMYWDIQKYDEMWWNMTSTVSNFIVWTGKLRLTPSTTIRWGHSHLLSVSLKAKKRKGNSRNSQSSDELNLSPSPSPWPPWPPWLWPFAAFARQLLVFRWCCLIFSFRPTAWGGHQRVGHRHSPCLLSEVEASCIG